MNQLYKILVITFLFVSCKQQITSDAKNDVASATEKYTEQEQTIQQFLNTLKKDFKENNLNEIVKKINNPFEFNVAGEVDYITDIQGLVKESVYFNKIIYARFDKEHDGIYEILYDKEYEETKGSPEGAFLIYFQAKKYKDGFKLISMEMPN